MVVITHALQKQNGFEVVALLLVQTFEQTYEAMGFRSYLQLAIVTMVIRVLEMDVTQAEL